MGRGWLGFLFGGIGGGLVGILIGALLATMFFYVTTGGFGVAYDLNHQAIAKGFTVIDATENVYLNLKHVQTGPAEWYPYSQDVFTRGATYTQSLWIWCSKNDIEISMVIQGPGDDGKSYLVGFGRHMGNAAQINGFGQAFEWSKDSDVGYASCIVTLS